MALEQKNVVKADLAMSRVLDKGGATPKNLLLYAQLLSLQKNYEAAKKVLKKVLATKKSVIGAYTELGKIYAVTGDFDKSIQYFEKAKQLSPKNLDRLLAMGESYSKKGDVQKAWDSINEVVEVHSDFGDAKKQLFTISVQKGNTKLSKAMFEQMGDPDRMGAYLNNHGVSLTRTGNFAEGLSFYNNAVDVLAKTDQSYRLYYNMALAFYRQGKLQEALNYLKKSIKANKKFIKSKALRFKINQILNPKPEVASEAEKETCRVKVPKYSTLGLYIFNQRLLGELDKPVYEIRKGKITDEEWYAYQKVSGGYTLEGFAEVEKELEKDSEYDSAG